MVNKKRLESGRSEALKNGRVSFMNNHKHRKQVGLKIHRKNKRRKQSCNISNG